MYISYIDYTHTTGTGRSSLENGIGQSSVIDTFKPQRRRILRNVCQSHIRYSERLKYVLVTDLVPSEIACLASSPGRISRTEVWISRDEIVDFLE